MSSGQLLQVEGKFGLLLDGISHAQEDGTNGGPRSVVRKMFSFYHPLVSIFSMIARTWAQQAPFSRIPQKAVRGLLPRPVIASIQVKISSVSKTRDMSDVLLLFCCNFNIFLIFRAYCILRLRIGAKRFCLPK